MRVLRIGLTGGIGSGKSTVANFLAHLGAHVVDTDLIARQLTAVNGAALAPIAQHFGPQALNDGELNRAWMRQHIFSDPQAKITLENILHPLILQTGLTQAQDHINGLPQDTPSTVIVFDIPLLAESTRWHSLLDEIWVIDCTQEQQVRRVAQRSLWDNSTILSVIKQQASRETRLALADVIIDNSGVTLDELRAQVQILWKARTDLN